MTLLLRILLVVSLLSPLIAKAQSSDLAGTTRVSSEVQILTRAAPTLGSEGMTLRDVAGFRVAVCAEVGQTLSGAGTLLAYVYDNDLAQWIRNKPADLSLTVIQATVRCAVFPDSETRVSSGRLLYAASGVTVSGGTTVTVQVKAWMRKR